MTGTRPWPRRGPAVLASVILGASFWSLQANAAPNPIVAVAATGCPTWPPTCPPNTEFLDTASVVALTTSSTIAPAAETPGPAPGEAAPATTTTIPDPGPPPTTAPVAEVVEPQPAPVPPAPPETTTTVAPPPPPAPAPQISVAIAAPPPALAPNPPPAPAPSPPTPAQMSGEQQRLLTLTNSARAAANLPPLSWNASLAGVSDRWSATMASRHEMSHNPDYKRQIEAEVNANWSSIAENVAYAATVEQAQNALQASPPHYANIVGAQFTEVGIGVRRSSDGLVWVTVNFLG